MSYKHYKKKKRKNFYDLFFFYFFKYHRIFFGSLINRGRKIWAFNFLNNLKYELKRKEDIEPNIIFYIAMLKITPKVLLYPYIIGRRIQYVPLPIGWKKRLTFATKWVIKLLKNKYRNVTLLNVTEILTLAIYDKGLAIKEKEAYYKMSTQNRYLLKYFKR